MTSVGESHYSAYSNYALSPEERLLFDEAVCGNRDAYAELFLGRIDGILRCFDLEPHEEQDDLRQDTFIVSFQALNQLKNPNSYPYWLYAVTRSIFLKRRRGPLFLNLESWVIDDCSRNELLCDRNETGRPSFYMDNAEKLAALSQAICLLSPIEREFINDTLNGLKIKEIAEHFHITEKTLRKRMNHVFAKLKNILESKFGFCVSPIWIQNIIFSKMDDKKGAACLSEGGIFSTVTLWFQSYLPLFLIYTLPFFWGVSLVFTGNWSMKAGLDEVKDNRLKRWIIRQCFWGNVVLFTYICVILLHGPRIIPRIFLIIYVIQICLRYYFLSRRIKEERVTESDDVFYLYNKKLSQFLRIGFYGIGAFILAVFLIDLLIYTIPITRLYWQIGKPELSTFHLRLFCASYGLLTIYYYITQLAFFSQSLILNTNKQNFIRSENNQTYFREFRFALPFILLTLYPSTFHLILQHVRITSAGIQLALLVIIWCATIFYNRKIPQGRFIRNTLTCLFLYGIILLIRNSLLLGYF